MPPPRTNLENILFGGGGDGKVACESFSDRSFEVDDDGPSSTSFEAPYIAGVYHPDGYDRNQSTKGLANPKSGPAAVAARKPRAASAAAAAAAAGGKPPVLALPGAKIQTAPRRPARGRIFPKKSAGRKTAVPEAEPTSPKVDCFGKVLSGKERKRRRPGTVEEREVRGWWAGAACALRCWGGGARGKQEAEKEVRVVGRRPLAPSRSFLAETMRATLEEEEEEAEEQPAPVGLGSMRAYASSRRTASWGETEQVVASNRGSGGHHS